MLTSHLKPGCLVYMQVEAEAPGALCAFATWVSASQAWQLAMEMTAQSRDAADVIPRDDGLIRVWQEAAHATTTLNVAMGESMRFLATMLRRDGIERPDSWAQTKLRALELEVGEDEQPGDGSRARAKTPGSLEKIS